jgi:hypothetical protein
MRVLQPWIWKLFGDRVVTFPSSRSICGRTLVLCAELAACSAHASWNRAEDLAVRTERKRCSARPHNGLEVNPRGQGPRGYGSAARRMPACKSRGAGGVPPSK